jgi:hypothetical protein
LQYRKNEFLTFAEQNIRYEFLNQCFYHSFHSPSSHSPTSAGASNSSNGVITIGGPSNVTWYPQTVYTLASYWHVDDDAIRYLHIRTLLVYQDTEHFVDEMIPQVSQQNSIP